MDNPTAAPLESTPAFDTGAHAGSQGDSSSGAKEQAKQAAGTAKDEGKKVAGVAQDEAQRVASEAKSQVRGLVDQSTSQLEDQGRTQLSRLVETLRSFGDDLEKMASQGDSNVASNLAHEVADRTRTLTSHLDGREPRDLLDDVRSFARRKPGVFLGSALVAGVVAGRLARGAKDAQSSDSRASYDRTAVGQSPAGQGYGAPVSRPTPSAVYVPPADDALLDSSTHGHGTAAGDPLGGVGTPIDEPVYPTGVPGDRL